MRGKIEHNNNKIRSNKEYPKKIKMSSFLKPFFSLTCYGLVLRKKFFKEAIARRITHTKLLQKNFDLCFQDCSFLFKLFKNQEKKKMQQLVV